MVKFFSKIPYLVSMLLMMLSLLAFVVSGTMLNFSEVLVEWEILDLMGSHIMVIFIFDYLSLFFLSLVSLVSSGVLIFSVSYMSVEKYFSRFIIIVLLFVSSMFLLVLSPNLISLLLGWDGLGVTSYLLVIFYQSSKSYNAGMITAMTNRLGDVGILICIGIMFSSGHWTFNFMSNSPALDMDIFLALLVVSACTKSAQVPFSAWLPAAMAAPTPVSALVHSSTLVTAGVFLLIRFNYLLISFKLTSVLLMIGVLTMFMAGAAAMLEMDMKKIIALSTLSQLGIMMTILGAQEPNLAFFHLLSHAYFKAMLFMCAGTIIHSMKDFQDIRSMGSVPTTMPTTYSVMMVANLSLCGLPFLSGFYSKDLILEAMMMMNYGIFIFFLVMLATFFTVAYSCRMSFMLGGLDNLKEGVGVLEDKDFFMALGATLLLPFSILGGMNISWSMFSSGPTIFLPFWFKLIILLIILSALLMSVESNSVDKTSSGGVFIFFMGNMWFLPSVLSSMMVEKTTCAGKSSLKTSESSWLEYLIFQEIFMVTKKMGKYMDFLSSSIFLSTLGVLLVTLFVGH